MELDRALELAVVSSWLDLVKPGENCLVRVEYKNLSGVPLDSLEVWVIRNRGYGTLVCRYSVAQPDSPSKPSQAPLVYFANSYRSKTLADSLEFIVRNQSWFSRRLGGSIHGSVPVDHPSVEDCSDAAIWNQAVRTEFSEAVWN